MNSLNQSEVLVVSLIIDNSYVVENQGFCALLNQFLMSLNDFISDTQIHSRIHLSIEIFDGLESKTLKDFSAKEFEAHIPCTGFPLMDRTLTKTLNQLGNHLNALEAKDIAIYKPWFVIISSGLSYDALSAFKNADVMNQINQLTVFPFLMDDTFLSENMITMNRLKPFMVIKDHQLNQLNTWLENMMKERISKPSTEKMKLNKETLKDWIYL